MDNEEVIFDDITKWTTYFKMFNGEPHDCISFWTEPNIIQIDWHFKRKKSVVYREELRDSAMFYSKDVKFIEVLTKFKRNCPYKFIVLQ